jgi:hypothetical protein
VGARNVAPNEANALNEAISAERSHFRRTKPPRRTKPFAPNEAIRAERSHLRRTKPFAPNEAVGKMDKAPNEASAPERTEWGPFSVKRLESVAPWWRNWDDIERAS